MFIFLVAGLDGSIVSIIFEDKYFVILVITYMFTDGEKDFLGNSEVTKSWMIKLPSYEAVVTTLLVKTGIISHKDE